MIDLFYERTSEQKSGIAKRCFINLTNEYWGFAGYHDSAASFGVELATMVRPMASNTGYLGLNSGRYELSCGPDIRFEPYVEDHVAANLIVQAP